MLVVAVRFVSNLVALLIVLAITVGIAVSVGLTISGFLQKQKPAKGVLRLAGGEAVYDPRTDTLWVSVRGYYQGAESVNIADINITAITDYGAVRVRLDTVEAPPDVKPNSYVKIVASGALRSEARKLIAEVTYCFLDGTCFTAREIIKINVVS